MASRDSLLVPFSSNTDLNFVPRSYISHIRIYIPGTLLHFVSRGQEKIRTDPLVDIAHAVVFGLFTNINQLEVRRACVSLRADGTDARGVMEIGGT